MEQNNIYARYSESGICIQVAKIKLLGIGKYCFETSLFNEEPYENNMNMPLFDTAEDAENWIANTKAWQKHNETGRSE